MVIDTSPVTIIFKEKGELTGEEYNGSFKIKPKLSPLEIMQCDKDRRDMLGSPKNDEQVGRDALELAIALSQLGARVVDAPTWFKESAGLKIDFLDTNIIFSLFKEVITVETKWREELKKAAEQAKEQLKKDNA